MVPRTDFYAKGLNIFNAVAQLNASRGRVLYFVGSLKVFVWEGVLDLGRVRSAPLRPHLPLMKTTGRWAMGTAGRSPRAVMVRRGQGGDGGRKGHGEMPLGVESMMPSRISHWYQSGSSIGRLSWTHEKITWNKKIIVKIKFKN